MNLNQKLAAAKTTYEVANADLKRACTAFEEGPKKDFAQLQENIAGLQGEITNHQSEQVSLKATLSDELQKSNGAKSPKVKETLAAIRDNEFVLEECSVLQQQLTIAAEEAHIKASLLADSYRKAYATAKRTWIEMNIYSALVECEERLVSAMAVDFDEDQPLLKDNPLQLVLTELERMTKSYQGEKQPYRSVIGTLDLGIFKTTRILTPGDRQSLRNKVHKQA